MAVSIAIEWLTGRIDNCIGRIRRGRKTQLQFIRAVRPTTVSTILDFGIEICIAGARDCKVVVARRQIEPNE